MTEPLQQPVAPQSGAPLNESDDRLWASLSHFGNIILLIPALLIFLILKDRGVRVAVESKEALNWTINVTGAVVVLSVFSGIPLIGLLFWLAYLAVVIVNIVFAIMAGLRVQAGGSYRYPVNIRWIK